MSDRAERRRRIMDRHERSDYPRQVKNPQTGAWFTLFHRFGKPSKSDSAAYRKGIWPAAKIERRQRS